MKKKCVFFAFAIKKFVFFYRKTVFSSSKTSFLSIKNDFLLYFLNKNYFFVSFFGGFQEKC